MRSTFLMLLISTGLLLSQDLAKTAREFSSLESVLHKSQLQPLPESPVLEGPVDAAEYILGPGDVLSIIILTTPEVRHQIMVDPEGNLSIPNVGTLMVADLSLADARGKIMNLLAAKYTSREITISLSTLRNFRVSVTGAVYKPGLVTVSGSQRVSDAITLAGGLKKKLSILSQTQQTQLDTPMRSEITMQTSQIQEEALLRQNEASQRNIVVQRKHGGRIPADLLRYQLTGDLEANPFLRNGDVIIVPSRQESGSQIDVNGAVKAPAIFEYAVGDRLGDLLRMVHGFTSDADSSYIEIVRFSGKGSLATTLRVDLTDPLNWQLPLQPDDRLYVRSLAKYHEQSNVEVVGEVLRPGHYAIGQKSSHLSEVIAQAGGFTSEASLKNAYVIRRADEDTRDPEFERLKKMNVAEMTINEREYFKIKSRELVGGMGVDFVALFENKDHTQDILLRDRDLIIIPAQEQTVKLTGQVVNPGLYIYKPGQTLNYYLQEAGGYNWNVRKSKVRIIKNKTGEWMKPNDDTIIEVGDTIFVPERPERDWWMIAKDLITVGAQMATIYLVIQQAVN
ncbi:hypothetical protein GX408_14660 [bacterium]|nr:hypothetical protein [bacterium]